MLRSRVIPCLLVHNKGLVKTVKFKDPKYVGDPINAVKIFNEKEVDELIVLDIDASVKKQIPDFKMIANLANECRMPLCYGGGITSVEHAQKIISLGVEKVALSSSVVEDLRLLTAIAKVIGRQSVVVVLDVKKSLFGKYEVFVHNGRTRIKKNLIQLLIDIEKSGVGEIVINSIDNDGAMNGFDLSLTDSVRDAVSVPLTFLGGAGSADDIIQMIDRYKIIGVAVGSFFVFKGKYKAVLISYLSERERARNS